MTTEAVSACRGALGVPPSALRELESQLDCKVLAKVECGANDTMLEGLLLERSSKLHADRQQGGDAVSTCGVLYIRCLGACCAHRPLELHSLGGCIYSGNAFEAHAGRSHRKKWRETIRVQPQGVTLKAWLSSVGRELSAAEPALSSPHTKEELVRAAQVAVAAAAAALAEDGGADGAAANEGPPTDWLLLSGLGMRDRSASQRSPAAPPASLLGSGAAEPPPAVPSSPALAPSTGGGNRSGVAEPLPAAARKRSLQPAQQHERAAGGRRAGDASGPAAARGHGSGAAAATSGLLHRLFQHAQQQDPQQQQRRLSTSGDHGTQPPSLLHLVSDLLWPAGRNSKAQPQAGDPWQPLPLAGGGSAGELPAASPAAARERLQLWEDIQAVLLGLFQRQETAWERVQQLAAEVAAQQSTIEALVGVLLQLVLLPAAAGGRGGDGAHGQPTADGAAPASGLASLASQLLAWPSGSGSNAAAAQQQSVGVSGGYVAASPAVAGPPAVGLLLQSLLTHVGTSQAADGGRVLSISPTAPSPSLEEGPRPAAHPVIDILAGFPHTAAAEPGGGGRPLAAAAGRKRPRSLSTGTQQ